MKKREKMVVIDKVTGQCCMVYHEQRVIAKMSFLVRLHITHVQRCSVCSYVGRCLQRAVAHDKTNVSIMRAFVI